MDAGGSIQRKKQPVPFVRRLSHRRFGPVLSRGNPHVIVLLAVTGAVPGRQPQLRLGTGMVFDQLIDLAGVVDEDRVVQPETVGPVQLREMSCRMAPRPGVSCPSTDSCWHTSAVTRWAGKGSLTFVRFLLLGRSYMIRTFGGNAYALGQSC